MRRIGEKGRTGEKGGGIASPRLVAVMASQALSLLGMEVLQFVLPLHLLNLTGSGALYGGVVAASFVPYTLLAPIGGVIADRTRKRGVMVAVNAALAAAMTLYLMLAATPAVVPATVAVLMVAFAAQALEQPCVQSAIPHLVPPSEVGRAVALVNQLGMLTGIGGPVAGGLVFGFLGLAPLVTAAAVCFAAAALVAAAPGRFSIRSVPGLLAGVAAGIALVAGALALPLPALGTFGALVGLYLPTMAACMCMSVVATSWLQAESPGTMVGKVMALSIMLANCATPLGQLGYGVALDHVPAWGIALLAAGATAAVAAWLARGGRGCRAAGAPAARRVWARRVCRVRTHGVQLPR